MQDLKKLEQTNGAVKIIKIDANSDEQINRARDEVQSEIGNEGLHLLINNSGIFEPVSFYCPKNIARTWLLILIPGGMHNPKTRSTSFHATF